MKRPNVLKITVSEMATEDRWILHGRLVGPWVGELKKVWQNAHRGGKQPRCVFNLNDVTFVAKAGERLLPVLAMQDVKFDASGIYVRGVLSRVQGKRTLS